MGRRKDTSHLNTEGGMPVQELPTIRVTKSKIIEIPFSFIKNMTAVEINDRYGHLLDEGYQLQLIIG